MKYFTGITVICFFAAMLFFPQQVFEGTQAGLILWIRTIFPALFPFMAGSGMMLSCGGLDILSRIAGPVFSVLFSTSRNGSYALITGFLCGYPMGAKTAADMVKRGLITSDEGKYLLSFCNNVSPSFILNFIVWKTFKAQELLVPTLLILMGVPAALSFIFRTVYLKGRRRFPDCPSAGKAEKAVSVSEAIDRSLTDSFESILKVGLYIIFFSVMISLLEAGGGTVASAVIPWLEISNGIWRLGEKCTDLTVVYPMVMAVASSGGVCAAAQTGSMIRGSGLPFLPYIAQKLAAAAAASLSGIIFINLYV